MDSEESQHDSSSSDSSISNCSSDNSRLSSPSSPIADKDGKSERSPLIEGDKCHEMNFQSADLPLSDNCCSYSKSHSNSDSNSECSDTDHESNYSNKSEKQPNEIISTFDFSNENTKTKSSGSSSSSNGSFKSPPLAESNVDLSDVSDLESERHSSLTKVKNSGDENTNTSQLSKKDESFEEDKQKSNDIEIPCKEDTKTPDQNNEKSQSPLADITELAKPNDEDALDFEAEEGECSEICKEDSKKLEETNVEETKSDSLKDEDQELEEGEVSDEDEKRPEETEPKPVCRFFTRGQCTWGMSCRFLHPGVTDKGNYTMFENMVRSVPVAQTSMGGRGPPYGAHLMDFHDYRTERPPLIHRTGLHTSVNIYNAHQEPRSLLPDAPIVVENAWERGLRTAKEMMRKANKKKEQDMDFDDKKMNLTVSPDDIEKEAFFHKERISPPDFIYEHQDRYGRGPPLPVPYEEIDTYGRSNRYRELPPHRMPHYEDERRVRPTREVIVQRVETNSRGDEWNDPWMRSKSPGYRTSSRERLEKRHRDRHSYSSNSSFSSSDSSQSGSSSDSSRSSSQENARSRYKRSQNSPNMSRKHSARQGMSPSKTIRRSRHSPVNRLSPMAKKRKITASIERQINSPNYKKKRKSPRMNRKSFSTKSKGKRMQSSSSSASDSSSNSSSSDSESDTVSSSDSSSRGRSPPKRSRIIEKRIHERRSLKPDSQKKRSPISIELKKPLTVGASALLSPTNSASSGKEPKKSRREELLKQLRAVEDAIAKKRSKLS